MDAQSHLSPSDLGLPPTSVGPTGEQQDRDEILRQLAAVHERDWLTAAFGTGEAAEFVRRYQREKLSVVQALERLADEVPNFRDPAQLELLANEFGRHPDAGQAFRRLVTPDLLRRIHRDR